MIVPSVRSRFSGFLVQDSLDAGHVAADGAHAGCILKLAGGLLEAQVERFLLQRNQAVAQLVGRLRFQFLGVHAPLPLLNHQTAPEDGLPLIWWINDIPANPVGPESLDALL
jgi:hypothetical protein